MSWSVSARRLYSKDKLRAREAKLIKGQAG
jgi:hypothetical protein